MYSLVPNEGRWVLNLVRKLWNMLVNGRTFCLVDESLYEPILRMGKKGIKGLIR